MRPHLPTRANIESDPIGHTCDRWYHVRAIVVIGIRVIATAGVCMRDINGEIQMKIMIACLTAILACSCHQVTDGSRSMHRRADLSRIMNEYFRAGDPYHTKQGKFEFRGPLAVAQVEQELAESYYVVSSRMREKADGVVERFEDSDEGKAWREFKSGYRDGDGLYFWIGIDREGIGVSEGYVLIRRNRVLGIFGGRCLAADWGGRRLRNSDDWLGSIGTL